MMDRGGHHMMDGVQGTSYDGRGTSYDEQGLLCDVFFGKLNLTLIL